jgi:hypothetical protein
MLMSHSHNALIQDGGEMERLLLDVYSSIGEPDGIYAVARSGDMASQLRLMQHEGAFAFCVPAQLTTLPRPSSDGLHTGVTQVTWALPRRAPDRQLAEEPADKRAACVQATGAGRWSVLTYCCGT